MKLEWMPLALKDRIEIFQYIAKDSPQNAIAVDDAIEAQCDQLMDFPQSARVGRIADTRELVISGYPFIVVYRLSEETVHLLRVINTSQQWPDGLSFEG